MSRIEAEVMVQADPNGPLMQAWNAYKATPEFANTASWAVKREHTTGSLWAAFLAGWSAAQRPENR